jgi:amidase
MAGPVNPGPALSDVVWLSATEQADLLRRREISSAELVRAYLDRIEALNPELGAYVTVCADEALAAARLADAQLASGAPPGAPFLGVPISIKDLVETKGVRTTYSSRAFADYVPDFDAAVVRRLKDAGFVMLGKTNTPEFGNLSVTESILNGACRNPWDTERTTGGSSGGAAAAVAAGLCPVGHGSDGGGSVRTPASCCGVVGLKPARGRVSCAPGLGESMVGLSTDGALTRTVLDAAAMLDVMAGYETGDPYWASPPVRPFRDEVGVSPGALRVAFTTVSPMGTPMEPDCVAAVRATAAQLASLGHHVEEACPEVDPASYDILMRLWVTAPCYFPGDRAEMFEPLNRFVLEKARKNSSADYVEAVNALHRLSRKVVAFWDNYDVLLTSVLLRPPVPIGFMFAGTDDLSEQFLRDGLFLQFFTPLGNVTGLPGMSLPLHWSPDGLPIGVHVLGPPAGEAVLLRLAAQLEAASPWRDRRPELATALTV